MYGGAISTTDRRSIQTAVQFISRRSPARVAALRVDDVRGPIGSEYYDAEMIEPSLALALFPTPLVVIDLPGMEIGRAHV